MRHVEPAYWDGLIRMGLTKLFMLRALADGPAHGYVLAQRATELSDGICSPTPGTIYPVLREWEEEGLVTGVDRTLAGRRRRVFELTEEGREACAVAIAVWLKAGVTVLQLEQPQTGRLADHLL